MFDDKKRGDSETVIGPSVKVEGNFAGSGDVSVDGQLTGTLKTGKSLRVGEQAKLKADVEAADVFVAGEIRGNVKASGRLELSPTAKLIGNVEASNVTVASGAVLHGKISMLGKDSEPFEPPVLKKNSRESGN